MTPSPQDLRQRIRDTIQRGDGSVRQIARRFLVSVSFVTRLLQLHRTTGSVEPRPHGGGHPAVLTPEDLRSTEGDPALRARRRRIARTWQSDPRPSEPA